MKYIVTNHFINRLLNVIGFGLLLPILGTHQGVFGVTILTSIMIAKQIVMEGMTIFTTFRYVHVYLMYIIYTVILLVALTTMSILGIDIKVITMVMILLFIPNGLFLDTYENKYISFLSKRYKHKILEKSRNRLAIITARGMLLALCITLMCSAMGVNEHTIIYITIFIVTIATVLDIKTFIRLLYTEHKTSI